MKTRILTDYEYYKVLRKCILELIRLGCCHDESSATIKARNLINSGKYIFNIRREYNKEYEVIGSEELIIPQHYIKNFNY